jgi:CheY-like chemotaxis protein
LNYSSWVEFNTWILEEKWQQMRGSVVLVVDDEALLRMLAADVFSEAGFEVLEASNGAQAIALMETRPDIRAVFTDVQMPGQPDGFALSRIVRGKLPSSAIVVVSGRAFPKEGDLPEGARFVSKPYVGRDVVRLMRQLLAPDAAPPNTGS